MDCLPFLYNTVPGRIILKGLTQKTVSSLCGHFLDCRLSKALIPAFIKKNHIDMSEYAQEDYNNFNSFFCRNIKSESRPIDYSTDHLIAPCDGKLSVFDINNCTVVPIKQSAYSIERLLNNKTLAEEFKNGTCLVFRLCVDNYHRYIYIESGKKGKNIHINGKLHTVRPIALEKTPVFTENSREYTTIETPSFGKIVQMEVGALLVGKIKNHHQEATVLRGQEKGTFLYGGSTIVVLLKNKYKTLQPHSEEISVKMGQCIAEIK